MKKAKIALAAALAMLAGGILGLVLAPGAGAVWLRVFYAFIGLGFGVGGWGFGEMGAIRARKKNPDLAKQIEIEQADERNIAVNRRAKAKAYDLMTYALSALMIFYLLASGSALVLVPFIAVYLLRNGLYVFWMAQYQKQM